MDHHTIVQSLKDFIIREMLRGDGEGLDADTPLLDLGVISSMSIVLLSVFMANEFQVEVPQKEMTVANLGTLDRMATMVERLRGVRV